MDPSHASAFGAPVAPAQPPSDVSLQDAEIEPLSRSRERLAAHARWGWLIPAFLLLAMIVLGFLFVGFRPHVHHSKQQLEMAQLNEVREGLLSIRTSNPEIAAARGRELWQQALRHGMLVPNFHYRLGSIQGPDMPADQPVSAPEWLLKPENCSYTGPQGSAITHLLQRKGSDRRVLVCHNARNWHNFPEHGVAVLWSDREEAEWLTFEQAAKDWDITEAEWADPAGKLFGKKAPFEYTYE